MSFAVSKETIYQTMRDQAAPYFKILPNDGSKSSIAINETISDVEMAISKLDEYLNGLTGTVTLKVYKDKETRGRGDNYTGNFTFVYKSPSSRIGSPQSTFNTMVPLDLYLALLRDKNEAERKLMVYEIKGDHESNVIGKIANRLVESDKLEMILDRFFPSKDQPSPNRVVYVNEPTKTGNDVLDDAIKRLYVFDPDLPNSLQVLAAIAETDPSMFGALMGSLNMYKNGNNVPD